MQIADKVIASSEVMSARYLSNQIAATGPTTNPKTDYSSSQVA